MTTASSTRPAAVAGLFYPGSRAELTRTVDGLLGSVDASAGEVPKAIVSPHAGYVYSGPIAARAFAPWRAIAASITRVVVVGPSHRVFFRGLASPAAGKLETPLGTVDVDLDAVAAAHVLDDARPHAREHSIEVQIPFIQRLFPHARIVPLVVGDASPEEVGRALGAVWGGDETRIVVSSDLSHYHPYAIARALDAETARQIVALEGGVTPEQACGCNGVNGLAWLAPKKRLRGELLDLRSSGDTAGSRDEVVGYGAFAFYEPPKGAFS